MLSNIPQRTKIIIAFSLIYLVWGSTFLFVKIGLQSFTPFLFSAFRFFIGGMALLTYAIVKKGKFPSLAEMPRYIISGIVIFIGGVVSVVWAQQYISSSLAAAIITTPFWFIVLDKKQWAFYFSNKAILSGLLLGLMGVWVLASQKHSSTHDVNTSLQIMGILVIIAGSFMWVGGSLYMKYRPSQYSSFSITSIQLLSAGVACSTIAIGNGEASHFDITSISLSSWFALIYLAIMSTTITFLAFIWLIKIMPPAIVSTYSYVNPLIATLLGWVVANEAIGMWQIFGLTVVLLGVISVNMGKFATAKKLAKSKIA